MCGIAGVISKKKIDEFVIDEIREMNLMLKHRGPDDAGIVGFDCTRCAGIEIKNEKAFYGKGMLSFNRLKVQDLSENGHQPMMNNSHDVILAFNGEIYNFLELREGLQKMGYTFRSRTDTEVILNLYLEYGIEMAVKMLNGMFALVLCDLRQGIVYIARDRFGIKPMYLAKTDNYFMFASEIKCFLQFHEFQSKLDVEILYEYMLYRNITDGSLFDGVMQILPGEFLEISLNDNNIKRFRFFDINQYTRNTNFKLELSEYKDMLWNVLNNAVQRQMISDVKVGCQLSGGIDSSLISYIASKTYGLNDTISIVIDDPHFSEEKYIDVVTETLHINSHKFVMSADYFIKNFVDAVWHFEGIMLHSSTLGVYQIAEEAKKKVTVLLSGEGADEVFGGYKTFLQTVECRPEQVIDHVIRGNGGVDEYKIKRILPFIDAQKPLQKRKNIYEKLQGSTFDKQIKYEMITYLPEILVRQDKMSMAHSIENRVPMLDNEVVECAFRIPEEYLINKQTRQGKDILKQCCIPIFGREFAYRSKMGFGIPTNKFLFSDKNFSSRILQKMKMRDIVNWKYILEQSKNVESLRGLDAELFYKTFCFEVWCELFLDKKNIMEIVEA